jgi:sugar O-acyltransferase (sialic acid O-acetyltransferase NeuD family)
MERIIQVSRPRELVIIGAGGSAPELVGIVEAMNAVEPTFTLLGFLDDNPSKKGGGVGDLPVLGGSDMVGELNDALIVLGVAHYRRPRCREDLARRLGLPRERYATLIHPSANVSNRATLGAGVMIGPFAMISPGATVGDHVFVAPYAHVSHDATVEDGATLAAGSMVCGGSKLLAAAYLGARSVLMDGVCVGEGAVVGIGAVVIRDVSPDAVVVGNPARPLAGRIAP